jgi:hypothetical protein
MVAKFYNLVTDFYEYVAGVQGSSLVLCCVQDAPRRRSSVGKATGFQLCFHASQVRLGRVLSLCSSKERGEVIVFVVLERHVSVTLLDLT